MRLHERTREGKNDFSFFVLTWYDYPSLWSLLHFLPFQQPPPAKTKYTYDLVLVPSVPLSGCAKNKFINLKKKRIK